VPREKKGSAVVTTKHSLFAAREQFMHEDWPEFASTDRERDVIRLMIVLAESISWF
jgi:hypothetical protein